MHLKEHTCQNQDRSLPFGHKNTSLSGGKKKYSPLPLFLTVFLLGFLLLVGSLFYARTAKAHRQARLDLQQQESIAALEEMLLAPTDIGRLQSGFEPGEYDYYTVSREEMDALEDGFWSQEIAWDTAYPSLSQTQKQAMQMLGQELSWDSLSEQEASQLLEDQGCTVEQAKEVLDVSRIDWNKQALLGCLRHLSTSAVSRQEMEHYLSSHGFTEKQVRHAILNCGADWKKQAEIAAQELFDYTGESRQGAIDFLIYYGYPQEDAAYAVDLCNRDFRREALRKAMEYVKAGNTDCDQVLSRLKNHHFTEEEAQYAVHTLGLTPEKPQKTSPDAMHRGYFYWFQGIRLLSVH